MFSLKNKKQPGHLSSMSGTNFQPTATQEQPAARTLIQPVAPNFQPPATQERDGPCGNQHYSRELLMMGITVPETCSAYHKYNKTISSI